MIGQYQKGCGVNYFHCFWLIAKTFCAHDRDQLAGVGALNILFGLVLQLFALKRICVCEGGVWFNKHKLPKQLLLSLLQLHKEYTYEPVKTGRVHIQRFNPLKIHTKLHLQDLEIINCCHVFAIVFCGIVLYRRTNATVNISL